jgi:polysaccharide pyruvyl transferase WcaK-like protein
VHVVLQLLEPTRDYAHMTSPLNPTTVSRADTLAEELRAANDSGPVALSKGDGEATAAPPTVVFFGHFGAGNWGNECTLLACLQNIRSLHPQARFICLSSKPEDTEQRYGLPVVGLLDIRRDMKDVRSKQRSRPFRLLQLIAAQPINFVSMLRVLRKADTLVMTGTGMVTDWGEGPLGLPLSMWQWGALASLLRCRVLFLSVGAEQIEHPLSRRLLKRSLDLADYRSFRDDHSRKLLEHNGIPAANDPICPDLAFALPVSDSLRAARKPGTVAVGVFSHRSRGANSAEDMAEYRAYVEKLGQFVLFLLERKKRVRLVIGDVSDRAVIEDVKMWLAPHNPPPFESEPADSVEQILQQLAEAELVVATRFHNILLSLRMGIPVLSISYEGKIDALMAEMGLAEFRQSIETLDVETLIEQYCKLEAEAPQVAPQIAKRAEEFRQQVEEQNRRLFGKNDGAADTATHST